MKKNINKYLRFIEKNADVLLVNITNIVLLVFGLVAKHNTCVQLDELHNCINYANKSILAIAVFGSFNLLSFGIVVLFITNIALTVIFFIIKDDKWKLALRILNMLFLIINFSLFLKYAIVPLYIKERLHA